MDKFTTLRGVAAPLAMINVDTDMIIPKQFLKTIKVGCRDMSELQAEQLPGPQNLVGTFRRFGPVGPVRPEW